MFRDLPQYTEFAPSASPWLPQLPAHWDLVRAKSLLTERVVKGHPDEPLLAATQSQGVIKKSDYASRTVTASKDLHLLKLVEVDDFVISLRSFQGGIERCHHRGIISPAYTVLTPKDSGYRDYLTYLFKSRPFIDSLTLSVTGIREGQNIDYSVLSVDRLPVPPAEEQAAIVKYLAHANARIDKAIAAKRRLIALLAEQKRIEVSELISTGNVQTKDRWFPQVKTGWDVVALGRVLRRAVDGPHFSPNYSETGVPFLSARNVRPGSWSFEDVKYVSSDLADEFDRRVRPEVGDVLYTKGGTTGVAKVVDVGERFQVWVHIAVLKLRRELVSPEFLEIVLNSPACYEQSQLETRGATNQDLGLGRMKRISIPLASLKEQELFVRQVKAFSQKTEGLIQKARREIALLGEFRARLMADVVTGQVDVRGIAVSLPDVPGMVDTLPEPPDDAVSESEE